MHIAIISGDVSTLEMLKAKADDLISQGLPREFTSCMVFIPHGDHLIDSKDNKPISYEEAFLGTEAVLLAHRMNPEGDKVLGMIKKIKPGISSYGISSMNQPYTDRQTDGSHEARVKLVERLISIT